MLPVMMILENPASQWMFVGTAATIVVSVAYYLKRFNGRSVSEEMHSHIVQKDIVSTSNGESSISKQTDTEKYPGGKVFVYFGSQTGTAETFSQTLVDEGKDKGFDTVLVDFEDFEPKEFLQSNVVLMVAATYGEGDPTDNAIEFVKWLKNKDGSISEEDVKSIQFAVFGLGNRQYEHYNAIGRLLNKQMEKLGASRVFEYGEGDDDGTLEDDFEAWKENLWTTLQEKFISGGKAADLESNVSALPHVHFNCEFISSENGAKKLPTDSIQHSNRHYATSIEAKVVVNRELRQSTTQGSTLHTEIDLKNTNITYRSADNLAILPENEESIVERVAACLSYKLDQCFQLVHTEESNAHRYPFPSPTTIRQALTCYLDLNHAPRRNTISHLAYFASNEDEKSRLSFLGSKEGKEEYHKWVLDEKRTLADVLESFPSLNIPLEHFIHLTPSLQPRYYTISSSSIVHPTRVHVTVSVLKEKIADGREFHGVCSTFVETKQIEKREDSEKRRRPSRPVDQGKKVTRPWPCMRIFVRESSFRLPEDTSRPIIMIGPGTGIAPMRAFLQERKKLVEDGHVVGKNILFFGCRRSDEDYIYKDELKKYLDEGYLSELHVAFSREQKEKVYVQHLMEKQGEKLWNLIGNETAYVYVCGATLMGADVHHVLQKIAMDVGKLSEEEAIKTLKKLQESGRYVQELWSA